MKSGHSIRVRRTLGRVLHVAGEVDRADADAVAAGRWTPVESPALPDQRRIVGFELGVLPVIVIYPDLDSRDAAISGERDSTDRNDLALEQDGSARCVDDRDRVDDREVGPAPLLPESVIVVIGQLDLLEPLDVLLTVETRNI